MTAAAAVVVAAGSGQRLGAGLPKALVVVAGRPLVAHAVDAVLAAGLTEVVVVHPPGEQDRFAAVFAPLGRARPVLVAGGDSRSDSVRAGLAALAGSARVVAVHDAARGLQPPEVITAAVAAVRGPVVAAAPALPVTDTIKRVAGERIVATLDRRELIGVQTPQVVQAALLRAAHAADGDATDDLGLVEAHLATGEGPSGACIVHVPGSPLGRKVTYPEDVAAIEALLDAS